MTRLEAPYGRALDRTRTVPFSFEGRAYEGFAGDTLASALMANDVAILARSFKYRRPRGVFGHGDLDAHCLVQVGDEPNVAADRLLLADGLPPILAQNRSGSVEADRGAWTPFLKRFLPVGFYYRGFFDWARFEPFIRRRAGLGAVNPRARHAPVLKQHLFCDVAVVGAGAAGLEAARAAAAAGARVTLIEAQPRLGGFENATAQGRAAAALPESVRVLTGAVAQGLFEDKWLAVEAAQAYYKLRAGAVVLATGLAEQPFVFRGNDLPGVMLASAARKLLWLHGAVPGRRVVVATANDHGLEAALDFCAAGLGVTVADARAESARGGLHDALAASGARVIFSAMPYEAAPVPGAFYFGGRLGAVRLARGGKPGETLAADALLMAAGYAPMAALACHAGAQLAYDAALASFALRGLPDGVFAAGSINHLHDADDVRADGARAGALAARAAGFAAPVPAAAPRATGAYNHDFPVTRHPRGGGFVAFDEDLTVEDIENAIEDGFSHPEHLKRWSTANMGPSQGRHGALNVLRVAARARGLAPDAAGATAVRPPTIGERLDKLAGKSHHPWRETPMDSRHRALGARMMAAGLWRRPAYYDTGAPRQEAILAEARAVREGVGLIDVSTLGKIELRGGAAAAFLDRVYATPHAKQAAGKSRYALLCDETGAILDDGVAARFAEDRIYLTTTTGQADATFRLLTWLQAQWRMDVDIAHVTGAFAAVNLAGPGARDVLARLCADVDLDKDAFPYLGAREGHVAGIPARLVRVGFTGELGYEIHVGARFGAALWDALMTAGKAEGIRPFGVEAQRLLRLEKGHLIVGQDTDGLTTPDEAGLARVIPKSKADYRGRAAIAARRAQAPARVLAGFRLKASRDAPPENCLVIEDGAIAGRVTSAAFSPALGAVIGLAFLPPARAVPGAPFAIRLPSGAMESAEAAALPFYDAAASRQEL